LFDVFRILVGIVTLVAGGWESPVAKSRSRATPNMRL
jgi:hypothetical protein